MTEVKATWLPNLVTGVSLWKLAVDLNEPKFFDGRLVIPETEGSDSLPINVRWNVAGLLPLGEARAKHPDEATQAIRDFFACVEKVQAELASPTSGFRKFKEAFTVPSLESDEGKNYFFSAQQKKLFVINWGASPRAIAGQSQLVFGFDDFGQLFEKNGIAREGGGGGAAIAGAAVVGAAAGAAAVEALKPAEKKDEKKKDEKKKDEKKKDEKKPWLLWGRPWWVWLLVALTAIALVLLILFFLRGCESLQTGPDGGAESAEAGADAASDAGLDAASDAAVASDAAAASDADDGGDAGSKDAATDARDAGDAGDGGKDGGKKDGGDAGGDDGPGGPGSGGPGGAGGPGGSGTVTIILAPGGGSGGPAGDSGERTLRYSQPGAAAWKVVAGKELLAPGSASDGTGETFEVHLKPGASMNGVKVEWQDQGGKWHL